MEIDVSQINLEINVNIVFHSMHNQINNLNLTTTLIIGNIIIQKYEDRNVVPYHASLFLLWGAHLNIQRTTPSYWSYYL